VAIPPPQPGEDAGDFLPQFSKRTKLLQQALNQVRYNNQEILRQKDKHKEATTNENEKSNKSFSCLYILIESSSDNNV